MQCAIATENKQNSFCFVCLNSDVDQIGEKKEKTFNDENEFIKNVKMKAKGGVVHLVQIHRIVRAG